MHLLLFARQRDLFEHLLFAGSMASLALFILTYATWGPALVLGYSATYRLAIASTMAGVALFPSVPLRLARRAQPAGFLGVETALVLGAAFALVWRDVAELQLWLYTAQAALLLVAGVTLRIEISLAGRRPWAWPALVTTGLLAVAISADILVDIGVLPRTSVLGGDFFAPLLAVPFAVCHSFALAVSWMQRRWGEPLDAATGLMPRERFTDRLGAELLRARRGGSPLAVALLRVDLSDHAVERDQSAANAVASLRRGLRQIDLLARYDPETFALLLAETDERAAMTIIERLRRTVTQSGGGRPGRARTTAGLAQYRPGRHLSADELLGEAEAALYAAVSEGGDCTATAP